MSFVTCIINESVKSKDGRLVQCIDLVSGDDLDAILALLEENFLFEEPEVEAMSSAIIEVRSSVYLILNNSDLVILDK